MPGGLTTVVWCEESEDNPTIAHVRDKVCIKIDEDQQYRVWVKVIIPYVHVPTCLP